MEMEGLRSKQQCRERSMCQHTRVRRQTTLGSQVTARTEAQRQGTDTGVSRRVAAKQIN